MEKYLMLFTHYLLGYVGTVICSVGLVLALCSVYIFTRRQMRSAVSTYLTGLSVSDSCLLFMGLIFALNASIPPNEQNERFYSSYIHKRIFPYVYACIIWFQFTSVWITSAFAIDRWFAIKWPMLHYTHSSKRACYIVASIYCLGFIYSLPRFFEYRTELRHETFTVSENQTININYLIINNKLLNSTIYQYTVHLTLYSVFQSILPLLMLSYFNVELIRSVNASSLFLKRCTSIYEQSTRAGGESNSIRYREGVITRSVICLIALFILCQVPASILHFTYMVYRNHNWLYICYDISNFLILLNSAVNFFIFTCFNRKFRRELARVCFYSKNRSNFLPTLSNQSLKRTSSYVRSPHQNQFDVVQTDSWEYQKRFQNACIDPLRKKTSASEYNFNSKCPHSGSLTNIRSTANPQLKYGRYSVCEFDPMKSSFISNKQRKSTNFTNKKIKNKPKDVYNRRHSERYSFNRKKYSTSHTTNSYKARSQPLHYIIRKHENVQSNISGPLPSNLTRSTMTTSSESSFPNEHNKLRQTVSINFDQSARLYRI